MKKTLLISLILGIGVSGALFFGRTSADLTPAPATNNREPVSPPASSLGKNLSDGGPYVHPVSIPALTELALDGRGLALERVLDETAAYTRYFITYASGALKISGILNIPKGDGPFPVLFLNHGYIDPAVYTNGRGLRREQDHFARNGFAVLHSDYRCHAQSDCPDDDPLAQRLFYAVDVMNAVQAVRTSGHPKLDGTRIGMLGHSMGGGITQTVMVAKPDLIRAAVLYAPVSSDYRDSFERYTKRRPDDAAKVVERYGLPEQNPEFWDGLAPRNYFNDVTAPIMISHGTADADVPLEWSQQTEALLKSAGKEVTFRVFPGQPHEFTTAWGTFMDQSRTFFAQQLGKNVTDELLSRALRTERVW